MENKEVKMLKERKKRCVFHKIMKGGKKMKEK